MAKDYFQDITPLRSSKPRTAAKAASLKPLARPATAASTPAPTPVSRQEPKELEIPPAVTAPEIVLDESHDTEVPLAEKSIRNIQVSSVKPRPRALPQEDAHEYEPPQSDVPRHSRGTTYILWSAAFVCVAAVGLFAFIATRPTSITIVPRTQPITFDQSVRFTAYPAATAPAGALSYTVQVVDLEDSEVVPISGTQHVEEKASGTLTVYNANSASPMTLVKNTRFESPTGAIFRVPADVVVPGKKGNNPGKVSVTVIADAPGDTFNVPAANRWTVPGLKGNKAMFENVYASSDQAMSGGFAGDRPGFAPGAAEAAVASLRARLEEKARASVAAQSGSSTVTALPGLARLMFETLPPANEAGGGARIRERAHVEIPLFSSDAIADLIAQTVSADSVPGSVMLEPGQNFAASFADPSIAIQTEPFQFSIVGTGSLTWKVDTAALLQAIAGRDEGAFQTIVSGFAGIQEAHARIQPFWVSKFPASADAIRVETTTPAPRS